ncbi:MAG: OmpA family protein, partial [Bernardetiaceae bacterium]
CIIIKNNIRNNISFVCDDSSIEVIPLEEKLLQLTEIYVLHDEYVLFGGHGSGLRALNVKDYSIASVKTEPNLLSVVHGLGLSLDGRFVTTLEEKKVTLWKFVREHIPEDTLIVKYIYFKLRSDEFENPSLVEKEMDSLIGLLSRYNTNYLIHIKAHTDMDLPPEYPDYELVKNLHIDLSKKRGNKIQKILISKGIAQNNIQVWPIGGQEPIVKDQKNSVLNRRVEFYIVKKSPPPPDRGE